MQNKIPKSWRFKFKEGLLGSIWPRTDFMCWRLMQDLAAAVSTLSQFGFGIVQLCLVSNRETWRRQKTGSFQPVSALEQCSGLSSESRDTDLWRRHSGTMTEAQVFASLAVMLSVNHMLLLLFYLSRRSCVQGCLDTHYSSEMGGSVQLRDKLFVIGVNGNT